MTTPEPSHSLVDRAFSATLKAYWPQIFIIALGVLFFAPFWFLGHAYVPVDLRQDYAPWHPNYPYISQNHELFDVAFLFWPQEIFYNHWIHKGVIPLWNPFIFTGHPLVGSGQAPLFYPFRLLAHYFFEAGTAGTLLLALHFTMAGLWFYLWLRDRGFSKVGACLGATTYMFNGQTLTWLEYGHLSIITSWLGLQLWLIDRACSQTAYSTRIKIPRFLAWGLLSVVWGTMILAGHLQYSLYVSALLCFYGAWRAFHSETILVSGISLACSVALMFCFGSLLLLPALEMMDNCQRTAIDMGMNTATASSLLSTLICPDLFGNPSWQFSITRCQFELLFPEFACFLGVVPLVLCISYLCTKKVREDYFWIAILLLIFPIASGSNVYNWLSNYVPLLGLLVPGRVILWFAPAVAYFAGKAIENSECLQISMRMFKALAALWAFFIVCMWWKLSSYEEFCSWWTVNLTQGPAGGMQVPRMVAFGDAYYFACKAYIKNPQMYLPLLIAAPAFWLLRSDRSLAFKQRALCLLAVVDTFYFGAHFNPHFPQDQLSFDPPSIVKLRELAAKTGLRVEIDDTAPFNSLSHSGLRRVGGYESMFPRRLSNVYNLLAPNIIQNMRYVIFSQYVSPVLDSLGLGYVIASPGSPPLPDPWIEVFRGQDSDGKVYFNPNAIPRCYWVSRWTALPKFADIMDAMGKPSFRAGDVFIEAPVEASLQQGRRRIEQVRYDEVTPQHIVMQHNSKGPGLVVLSDTYYPGWEARVNGKSTLLLAANGSSRAVPVENGDNTIEMDFKPVSLQRAFKLLGIGVILLAFILFAALVDYLRPGIQIAGKVESALWRSINRFFGEEASWYV